MKLSLILQGCSIIMLSVCVLVLALIVRRHNRILHDMLKRELERKDQA